MCSSLTVRNLNSTIIYGSGKGVGLDMRWLISLFGWTSRPKLIPIKPGYRWGWRRRQRCVFLWNRSPGTRKPQSGKHLLDGEMFRNTNKQTKITATYYWVPRHTETASKLNICWVTVHLLSQVICYMSNVLDYIWWNCWSYTADFHISIGKVLLWRKNQYLR